MWTSSGIAIDVRWTSPSCARFSSFFEAVEELLDLDDPRHFRRGRLGRTDDHVGAAQDEAREIRVAALEVADHELGFRIGLGEGAAQFPGDRSRTARRDGPDGGPTWRTSPSHRVLAVVAVEDHRASLLIATWPAITIDRVVLPTGVMTMRWLFVAAVGVFTLASAGCAGASGFGALVAWRVLQGFAGGTLIPAFPGGLPALSRAPAGPSDCHER